jgi:hypothetical protein
VIIIVNLASMDIVTSKVSNAIKNKAHGHISKGELLQLDNLIKESSIFPQEEISQAGFYWNLLHYSAHFGAMHILEYLVKLIFFEQKENFENIINAKTVEGCSPLMIAAKYNKPDCIQVLIDAGGVKLGIRNKDGRTALHLANNYKAKPCQALLETLKEKGDIPIHEHWLSDFDRAEYVKKQYKFNIGTDPDNHKENEDKGLDDETVNKSIRVKDSLVIPLLKKCQEKQKNYLDDSFPHQIESITKNPNHEHFETYKASRWLRPHQIFNCDYSKIKLFDQIDPNDIRQGSLGVCYFLSVLSALAEFPERVKKIFSQTEANKYGVYGVNFFFQGIPTEVVVDDFFACMDDKLEPVFAKPNGNELWVLLLEKAWAKYFGGYTVVEYEVVDYAMEEILGVPSMGYWVNKYTPDALWKIIVESDKKKYLISATSAKDVTKDEGLVPTHAYTVISALKVDDKKLLKLRNPWGNFEWKGQYGDESAFWTEAKKKAANYTSGADDGIFYMDINEFHSKFSYVSVACYEDNWKYSFQTTSRDAKHAAYFEIEVTDDTPTYFRLHQKNERLMLDSHPDYVYSPVQFQLFKKEGGEVFNGHPQKYFGRKTILANDTGIIIL